MIKSLSAFLFAVFLNLTVLGFQPVKSQDVFQATPMLNKYIGETVPGHPVPVSKGVNRIIYLTDVEREQFRVIVTSGIVYNVDGTIYRMQELNVNYVLDSKGNLYFFENEKR